MREGKVGGIRAARRLYRFLSRLLPADFRRRYAEDAARLFEERLRAALEEGGLPAAAATAARGYVDVLMESVTGRLAPAARTLIRTEWREMMRTTGRDFEQALRALWRSPRHAAATVGTFAVAIAATTAIYSAIEGLLLEPLPFPESERLVFIGETSARDAAERGVWVTSRYSLDIAAEHARTLEGVAAYNIWEAVLSGHGDPVRLSGAVVGHAYLRTLGHPPLLGRLFREEDATEGAPRRVVVSHRLWTERLSGDRAVVGSPVELDGRDYEVVGVMPPGFETPDEYTFSSHIRGQPDIWTVFRRSNDDGPGNRSYRGIARLAPGATLEQASAEMQLLNTIIGEEYPTWAESSRLTLLPLKAHFTAPIRPALHLLLVAVGFVLLTGCVNVMSLVLTRGVDREAELRVRSALGAARPVLLRHIVVEILVLGLLGGILGVALGGLALEGFLRAAPADVPLLDEVGMDPSTVGVAVGVTFLVALVSGLVPGVRLLWGRSSVAPTGGRTTTASLARRRTLGIFAGAQIALALVLLTGAGLLLRSFERQLAVDPGFDAGGVAVVQLDLPSGRYDEDGSRGRALDRILERLEGEAGVARAGISTTLPQHGLNNFGFTLDVEGYEPAGDDENAWARFRGMSDGYPEAMGIELVRGRYPASADAVTREEGPWRVSAVAVNEEFVRRWLPDGDPLGRMVFLSGIGAEGEAEIVGLVRDTRHEALTSPPDPEIYVPAYDLFFTVFLVARAAEGDAATLPPLMREAVREVDPLIPTERVFFQERLLEASMAESRTVLLLMTGLALFALLLSTLGLAGVVSHGVARRTREFGIRLTVGASRRGLVRMVLRQGARPLVGGAACGLLLAWATGRFAESLLFQVEADDPVTFAAAATLLIAVGLVATWLPARRATRLDPVQTLRTE